MMQPQRIDLSKLKPAEQVGRTCWTWRSLNEEGLVQMDPDTFRDGGGLRRAILAADNDLHAQWRSDYMIRAYPRSGRNRCRGN